MPRGKAAGKGRHGPSRRAQDSDGDGGSAWLTTYGDAVTLLLAFFVMLFSLSSTDAAKFEIMAESMRAAFSAGTGILPADTGLVGDEAGQVEPGPETTTPPSPVPLSPSAPSPAPSPGTVSAAPQVPDITRELADEIHAALADAELLDIAEVAVTPDSVVIRIRTDEVLFATGSAEVREPARQILAVLAPSLVELPHPIRVEGHTDDVPLDHAGYTNWNLSADRAVAVVHLMVEDHAIAPQRLSAVGYGEFVPLVPNADPGGRSQNRRVEIVVQTNHGTDVPDLAGVDAS